MGGDPGKIMTKPIYKLLEDSYTYSICIDYLTKEMCREIINTDSRKQLSVHCKNFDTDILQFQLPKGKSLVIFKVKKEN
jgi:hypothetical protein